MMMIWHPIWFEGDLKEERDFIHKEIEEKIIKKTIPLELINDSMRIIVNGTGRFVKSGPERNRCWINR